MKSTVTTFAELILLATAGYAQQKNRPSPAIADAAIASHITIPDAQVLKPYKHVDLSYMGDAAIPFPFAAPALRNRTLGDMHGHVDLSYMGDAAIPFPFAAPALRNRTLGDVHGYVDLSYMGDAAIPFPFAAPALRNRTFGDTN